MMIVREGECSKGLFVFKQSVVQMGVIGKAREERLKGGLLNDAMQEQGTNG